MSLFPDPPAVISTSYGDAEQTVPRSYAVNVCRGFAKLSQSYSFLSPFKHVSKYMFVTQRLEVFR